LGQFNRDKASRIVFIFRSIPDVIVSNYFHRSRFMKWYDGDLKDFIRNPKDGVAKYCRYLNLWAPVVTSGQQLVLTYEMLHEDTVNTVAGLLEFLDIPVDIELLRNAVQSSTFDAMQTIENERGMPSHQPQPDDPEDRRIRKGKVGGSADYLDREDLEYIFRTTDSLLTGTSKELLRRCRLWDR
jgi:alcohol sulfotransferase